MKDVRVGEIRIERDKRAVTVIDGHAMDGFVTIRTRQEARELIFALGDVFGTPDRLHASAVKLGRRGGKKGGKARAATLTPAERSAIARDAANARWHGRGKR